MNESIRLLLDKAPDYAHEICVCILFFGILVLLLFAYFDKLNL